MEVMPLLRENGCAFGSSIPEAPSMWPACGRVDEAREGSMGAPNAYLLPMARYPGAEKLKEARGPVTWLIPRPGVRASVDVRAPVGSPVVGQSRG